MRTQTQVNAIADAVLNGAIFALEAVIVSVSGGRATVKPTPKRLFGENPDPVAYSAVENVRLMSLVWGGGKSGISGSVKAGDPCLLVALSHGDGDEPDHKTLANCVALTGFSDVSAHAMPDSTGVRVFSDSAFITLDDNSVGIDSGGGASITLTGDKISIKAPGGLTLDAPETTATRNMTIAGAISQGEGESGGNATFGGDVDITGTSTATDHISGGKSGGNHTHLGHGSGNQTDAPT
ncbi:phage baseplate protein [Kosakonia sacchari]|uniref:phage baseplate protein n=1 Tax=Kosakonia sacchari TaxID=1158459 RepID=UPI001584A134|nr:phage baseplate protein [Kosakonia sacchari]NUL35074.1 phage baseplate protein [Kosakonia sacchari]